MFSGPAEIVVLAGVDGAGKSSVAGAALENRGGTFYNPDEATRAHRTRGLTLEEANARAWRRGREQLERANREGTGYAFEATLGGRTMTRLLLEAAAHGHRVRIWYVGLASPELHIQRVRERVARGGHDVPDEKIRERWKGSRENLIRLMPHVAEVVVWDNSATVALHRGDVPGLVKLLHIRNGLHYVPPLDTVPTWAKPLVEAAIRIFGSS